MQFYQLHPSLATWMQALDTRISVVLAGEHPALQSRGVAVMTSRGKRVRPAMLLLACAGFGEVAERAFTQAALVELIHTASLVHDDVVDEADYRRGAPSAPARWGNKFSVLLGDYLFSRVFELAVGDGDPTILRVLSSTATEMGRAVTLEMTALEVDAPEEIYWRVIRGKTAVLFAAATTIGALVGGATPQQQQAMHRMGEAFGYAFQLADDLMDLQGTEEATGKPLGVDWRQRRATLPLLHALRTSSGSVAAELRALWQQDPFTDAHLQALRCLVEAAGGFEYSWQKVKEYREEACTCLECMPAGAGQQALLHLCRESFPLPVLPTVA